MEQRQNVEVHATCQWRVVESLIRQKLPVILRLNVLFSKILVDFGVCGHTSEHIKLVFVNKGRWFWTLNVHLCHFYPFVWGNVVTFACSQAALFFNVPSNSIYSVVILMEYHRMWSSFEVHWLGLSDLKVFQIVGYSQQKWKVCWLFCGNRWTYHTSAVQVHLIADPHWAWIQSKVFFILVRDRIRWSNFFQYAFPPVKTSLFLDLLYHK